MEIRKATKNDIAEIVNIFSAIHKEEEEGRSQIGWVRGVYPTEETAKSALMRGDLFVLVEGKILGAAIINQIQMDSYKEGKWQHEAEDEDVMVLHTLVISPDAMGKGYGKSFVSFYESYALSKGCRFLRMDTNEKNKKARALYEKLGYSEIDIVKCDFNGIEGINLVLLEKYIN